MKYHGLHKMFQHNRVRISTTGRDASSCHFVKACFQLKLSLAYVSPFPEDGVVSEVRGIIKGRILIMMLLLPLYPVCQQQGELGCFPIQTNKAKSSTQTHLFSKHDLV
jgi:hypothetical protein